MNRSIGDAFEDCIDSLANLPSEVNEKMLELRAMDEEFQQHRDAFRKQRRAHLKLLQNENKLALKSSSSAGSSRSPTTPSPAAASASLSTAASLDMVENEYKAAMSIQEQKIDAARRLYDRVSLHIEQLDFEMVQNDIHAIPTCGLDRQQQNHHHHHQRSFPCDRHAASSSSSSTYHHPHPMPRSPSSMDMQNVSSYHPQNSTSGASRKHAYGAEGSRKNVSSHGSTGSRKRPHYSARSDPPINIGIVLEQEISPNEPRYCYCNQVSYGDMVACDGENCEKEWFHYSCVGLTEPPVGKWFCDDCMVD